jgi:hypothetical protein
VEYFEKRDEPTDEIKLLRAFNLLASTIDDQRAVVGPISRDWVKSEIEKNIRISEIPLQTLKTTPGLEILKYEIFPDNDIGPNEIDIENIDLEKIGGRITINTNRLPKLEPLINAAVLTGILLFGAQKYGREDLCHIDSDLIIAAMIYDTLGRKDRFSALLSSEYATVDDQYISDRFGDGVLSHVKALMLYLDKFESEFARGTTSLLDIPCQYANAIATLMAARLRLSARAAGDQVFSTLDEQKKQEIRMAGIETEGEFPERPHLEQDFRRTKAALSLKGVDYTTIREPLTSTLMTAVEDVLEDTTKLKRLCGRRGKAIHDVHINLPMMELYNAAEAPNSIDTLYVAALETMRYLDRGRRKGNGTMLAHSFRIAGIAEQVLGRATSPIMATVAILHDVVEDGCRSAIGYDENVDKLKLRFGGPVAAMVSEVTDSNSRLDGPKKAQTTFYQPSLVFPEKEYNVSRFVEMHIKPTDADRPYTLPGILTKLIDTVVTQEEGLRDPDIMLGWWKHSGIRIFWDQCTKGNITRPLMERLILEVKLSRIDVNYHRKNDAVSQELLDHICQLLARFLDTSDMYMTQNLAILADEYGLREEERQQLLTAFVNPQMSRQQFEDIILDNLLDDKRLEARIESGVVPGKAYVTLFKKADISPLPRDSSTFMAYRESALRRCDIRAELGLDTPTQVLALKKKLADVTQLYDLLIPIRMLAFKW